MGQSWAGSSCHLGTKNHPKQSLSSCHSEGFSPELCTEFEEKAAPAWKRADIEYFSPDRLEAYPTLRCRLVAVDPRRPTNEV
jgi:hypothetical protein